jgi:hypothetical protein
MESEEQTASGGLALDVLTFGLWLVVVAPLVTVPLALVLLLSAGGGESGSSSVSGRLDPPYAIEFSDGRRIEVPVDALPELTGSGATADQTLDEPRVELMVPIETDHWWQDAASWGLAAVLAAIAWFVAYQSWQVVRSARRDDPFTRSNIYRLRWIAVSLAAAPLLLWGMSFMLDRLVTPLVPATLLAGPSWGAFLLAAIAVLAISEVFRAGVHLRDLQEGTV